MSKYAHGTLPVAGIERLRVYAHLSDDQRVMLHYWGFPDELIAAGICTAAMLEPNPRRGPKSERSTPDGYPFRWSRYWASREGQPMRRYGLRITLTRDAALHLPGGAEAMAAAEARRGDAELGATECSALASLQRPAGAALH